MDRICLSVAILPMAREFGWPASLQGVIQSAFLWGYMATQLLGGALADRRARAARARGLARGLRAVHRTAARGLSGAPPTALLGRAGTAASA